MVHFLSHSVENDDCTVAVDGLVRVFTLLKFDQCLTHT